MGMEPSSSKADSATVAADNIVKSEATRSEAPAYQVNDEVWLNTTHVGMDGHPSHKLTEKWSQIRFSPNDLTLYPLSKDDHISCSLEANITARKSKEDELGTQEDEIEDDLENDADMGIPDLEADQDPNLSLAVPKDYASKCM
ncbi:hypothetical protein EDC04DRAFT_2894422 [Pisolithus marmoratus]|nr:hypothetical protein EDC04DRAFT_2894422 [Pisolithus marmoratus]